MTPGLGIFLIAAGAIIRYAINISIAGIEEDTIGLILMIAGVAVIAVWLIWLLATRRDPARRDPAYERPVDPRERPVDPRYRA
jgi:hypothetical protein